MARRTPVFADNTGKVHDNARLATVSDLARALGSYVTAVAVFDNRAAIEKLFAEHDAMLCDVLDEMIPAADLT